MVRILKRQCGSARKTGLATTDVLEKLGVYTRRSIHPDYKDITKQAECFIAGSGAANNSCSSDKVYGAVIIKTILLVIGMHSAKLSVFWRVQFDKGGNG
ncbi:MAG TPA: hypothetical protein VJ836_06585 [Candidatus Saccharimonadales bacterium]|nr:hypothetical protein [Candidatus Saccharimonadales bacterium]